MCVGPYQGIQLQASHLHLLEDEIALVDLREIDLCYMPPAHKTASSA